MSIIYKPTDTIAEGRYKIIKLIGEGGTGFVYLCLDKHLLKDVAIKILRHELVEDKKLVEIFKHEAQLAAQLNHPNIVQAYGADCYQWHKEQVYFLVMEYLSGGNLTAQIKSAIPLDRSIKWIRQLLNAMVYAHDKGVIHQDIKSSNIYLTEKGDVKIGDFGLARLTNTASMENISTTASTHSQYQKMGTPSYMSPELCFGEIQDERSDIYSLGVLFFEMLVGKMPFEAAGIIELARQHVSKPVPSLRRINPEVPTLLDEVVQRMMAKNKDERFQSANQILNAIASL